MKFFVSSILSFAMGLIQTIFSPLDSLIYSHLPSLSHALTSVASFFNWLVQFVNWALSWLPLSSDTWNFIIATLIFRFTVPILVDGIKLIVKWWHALVP